MVRNTKNPRFFKGSCWKQEHSFSLFFSPSLFSLSLSLPLSNNSYSNNNSTITTTTIIKKKNKNNININNNSTWSQPIYSLLFLSFSPSLSLSFFSLSLACTLSLALSRSLSFSLSLSLARSLSLFLLSLPPALFFYFSLPTATAFKMSAYAKLLHLAWADVSGMGSIVPFDNEELGYSHIEIDHIWIDFNIQGQIHIYYWRFDIIEYFPSKIRIRDRSHYIAIIISINSIQLTDMDAQNSKFGRRHAYRNMLKFRVSRTWRLGDTYKRSADLQ